MLPHCRMMSSFATRTAAVARWQVLFPNFGLLSLTSNMKSIRKLESSTPRHFCKAAVASFGFMADWRFIHLPTTMRWSSPCCMRLVTILRVAEGLQAIPALLAIASLTDGPWEPGQERYVDVRAAF